MKRSNSKPKNSFARKPKETQETHVLLILDESGSMTSVREPTVQAFNEVIQSLKLRPADERNTLTLTTFHSELTYHYTMLDVAEVAEITMDQYKPRSMTALYDAVGTTINRVREAVKNDGPNVAYLVYILSDGGENDSKQYKQHQIASLLTELKSTGRWTINYIGTDHDLADVQSKIQAQTVSFKKADMANLGRGMSMATTNYMNSRSRGLTSYDTKADMDVTLGNDS